MISGQDKDKKMESVIVEAASQFIARETSGFSLITITGARIEDRGARAIILFTVLPDNEREAALGFLKRKRGVFRDYIKEKTRLHRIPLFDFELDRGEINRQRIDALTALQKPL